MDFNCYIECFEVVVLCDVYDECEMNVMENDVKIFCECVVCEGCVMCDEEGGDGVVGFGGVGLRDSGEREDVRRLDVGFGVY